MQFHLIAYVASCVILDPGTAMQRCRSIYEQPFATVVECATSARNVMKDRSQRAVCIEEKGKQK